jgi:hypothetical protein
MARARNKSQPRHVKVSTSAKVVKMLDYLVQDGRFGKTRSNVAEFLVLERLQQLELPFAPPIARKGPRRASEAAAPARRRAGGK